LRSTDSTTPSLPLHLLGDRRAPLGVAEDPRLVALEPEAGVAGVERRVDEPVRLGVERLDLALALDDHRERRRLTRPSETTPPTHARPRSVAARVAFMPTSQSASLRERRRPRGSSSRAGAELSKPVLDRLLRHRADPEPLDGLSIPASS
jgi:hypothetical protein